MMAKLSTLIFMIQIMLGLATNDGNWIAETNKNYTICYTQADKQNKDEYLNIINNGIKSVNLFFGSHFGQIFVFTSTRAGHLLIAHCSRTGKCLISNQNFWMVASGVALKLDMISPKIWDKTACGHAYAEALKTRQLITHELSHVFQRQPISVRILVM